MENETREFKAVKADLELAAWSALSILHEGNMKIHCSYYQYSELKATARLTDSGSTLKIKVSDGFEAAEQDVVTGLLVHLLSRLLRKRSLGPVGEQMVKKYKEFSRRKSTAEFGHSIHRLRHRSKPADPIGRNFNLDQVRLKVLNGYHEVFGPMQAPEITWSKGVGSKRILAYHDRALGRIVVSKRLDSAKIPEVVLERIVFHELLHAKHGVVYERGHSMQARAHTKEFFADERIFRELGAADCWLERNRI